MTGSGPCGFDWARAITGGASPMSAASSSPADRPATAMPTPAAFAAGAVPASWPVMTFGIAKKFTPRGVALLASAASTLLVTLVLTWLITQGLTPPVLQRLDLFIHDNWVRSTLQFTGTPKVTLLALDEASLQRIGQWPWPRDRIAQVVQAVIDQHGARAIAFDMVFAEPDRSDADRIRERLARTPGAEDSVLGARMRDLLVELDRDAALARVLAGRPVVLGHYFTNDASQRVGALPDPWLPADIAHQSGVFPPRGDGYGANLASLVQAAGRAGHMNPAVDADGVTRRLPLLIENEGMLYPSLMLAALTIVAGDQAQVDFGQATTLRGQPVAETITLGPYRLPIDEQARSMLPFFGGRGSVPTVSVLDMLEGRMPPDLMRGRVVVFGPTAPGLRDSRATPVDTNQPGTELHVSWLQGALDARLPSRPHYTDAAVLSLVWCVALGMMAGAWRLRPARFVATAAALALAVWSLGWWVWRHDRLVLPVAVPLVQIGVLFVALGALGYLLELRGRSSINRLFGQYVPPELVNEMNEDPDRYSMSGRAAELTVMFADVRGFTTISENLEPTALGELMNALLTDLSRVIRADHLGTIDKYIGDCVMAFWGAPVARPDHAAAGVAAALDMQRSLARLVPRLSLPPGATIAIGIGLHTGRAVVGNMGSAYRMAYTVMGDTVNTASRLEGLTKAYGAQIVAGESVRLAAAEPFLWRQLDLVRVKGRDTPLAIHEPLCRTDEATDTQREMVRRHEAALARYLARDFGEARAQWQALQDAPDAALHSELHAVWIKRCEQYLVSPPPADWDGVHTFETK